MDFETEFNEIIGLCYVAEPEFYSHIVDKVHRFLKSDAPHDLKTKSIVAVIIQAAFKDYANSEHLWDSFNYQHGNVLVELLNQQYFVDCLAESFKQAEYIFYKLEEYVIPYANQFFSNDTVLYALSREDIPNIFATLFISHPAILSHATLQRKAFKGFINASTPVGFQEEYPMAVFITDEVINEFDLKEQLQFFSRIALYFGHDRIKKVAFSFKKMCEVACLYLVTGNREEQWQAESCLKVAKSLIELGVPDCVSADEAIKLNIKPKKCNAIFTDELINPVSVITAIEKMTYRNMKAVFWLLYLYPGNRIFIKGGTRHKVILNKFRTKLIEVAYIWPKEVKSFLDNLNEAEKGWVDRVFEEIEGLSLWRYTKLLKCLSSNL